MDREIPDIPDIAEEIIRLEKHQQELHGALSERAPMLADVYFGAIVVLGQAGNPDRLAHSAHSIREVMDRLARTSDAPIRKKGPDTNSLIQPIADAWEKLISSNEWPGKPPWESEINASLRKFLKSCQKLIPKIRETRKKNKDQASDLIESHNVHELSLPTNILENRAREWMDYRKVFVGVAHHEPMEETMYKRWLTLFEEFLLNLVLPRTVSDQKKILKMIDEAEHANS